MRRTTIAALVAAGLLLTGCADGDGDPGADPSSTPGSTSSEPSDPAASEPTETTEPSVEPAAGFEFDRERITMRAPEGWKRAEAMADFLLEARDPDSRSSIILSDLGAVGQPSLQEQVRAALLSTPQLEELDPVEIAGAEWYHLAGRDGRYHTLDSYGTVHNDSMAVIDFRMDDEVPEAEQEAIIASVLATVEWK